MSQDIIIIGAGPAGLSLAGLLGELGLKVVLIDQQSEQMLANPSYDGREIALTHLSRNIMQKAGIWDQLEPQAISLIRDARVLNGNLKRSLFFDHRQTGKENLGFMVSNQSLRRAAYRVCKPMVNVRLISGEAVDSVTASGSNGYVTLTSGTQLDAPLLVAADSRFSQMRSQMGIATGMRDFGRTCIVSKFELERDHDQTAYECFFYDRTLAVLPLAEKYCSIVITLDTQQAREVMEQSVTAFSDSVRQRLESRFGEMTLISERFAYPLVGTFAQRFYSKRFALLGDAAVGMHPVTAHGFNFGLRGAATLANEIENAYREGIDHGGRELLQRYHRAHRKATLPLYLATNALVSLYTQTSPLARLARRALLEAGQYLSPAKRLIMKQLTESS